MKHIVMETGENYAVVLSDGGKFTKIRNNKNYAVGQEIALPRHNYSSLAAIAASLAVLFLSAFSGYRIYSAPEGYVSVDINPSIQLVTNRFNKVIDTQSFNSDGQIVLEQGKVKHKSIEDSIERIIDVSISLGYLTENKKNVVIDVVAGKEDTVQALQNKVEKYSADSIVIEIEQADEKMLNVSKELGESVGRAKAIYDYTGSNGGDIKENKKKLEKESVAEIKKIQKPQNKETEKITKQSIKEEKQSIKEENKPKKINKSKPEKADKNKNERVKEKFEKNNKNKNTD